MIPVLVMGLVGWARAEVPLQPPEVPGYAWIRDEPMDASFLQPHRWSTVADDPEDGSRRLVISPRARNGDVSFTVLQARRIPERYGFSAIVYAGRERQSTAMRTEIRDLFDAASGAIVATAYTFDTTADDGAVTTHRMMLIANEATGTVHSLHGQAPASRWKAALKRMAPLFEQFVLDDEV